MSGTAEQFPTKIVVLGATGHIGASTVSILRLHPLRFRITALTAGRNVKKLASLCKLLRPDYAVISDPDGFHQLRQLLVEAKVSTVPLCGEQAVLDLVRSSQCETVVAGIAGSAGFKVTMAAVKAGKRVLLASKEVLVMAGHAVMHEAKSSHADIIPLDSEHFAVFQCLHRQDQDAGFQGQNSSEKQEQHRRGTSDSRGTGSAVHSITLTASGGPFLNWDAAMVKRATPQQACLHPNWKMGRKISVDSATLMNKGLELMEAFWLFGLDRDRYNAVIHPQSLVHALVNYCDGAILAQISRPDMRIALSGGLLWPQRVASGVRLLDFSTEILSLDFRPIDQKQFPCYQLALEAMALGSGGGTVLNAANDMAVDAFLRCRIPFPAISATVDRVLDHFVPVLGGGLDISIEGVLDLDAKVRSFAGHLVGNTNKHPSQQGENG